jgi:FtsH-binding integral membrane protein
VSQVDQYSYGGGAVAHAEVDGRTLFGQVMSLVAITVAFAAVGAYIGRDTAGGIGLVAWIGAFGCLFALNVAAARGAQQLAMGLLFAVGLLLGLAAAPTLAAYARAEPDVVAQAAGATALFVGGFGAYGYATRRDLSRFARTLFWSLLALIVVGFVLFLFNIPNANLIYAVLGLAVFAGYTMYDFNRLRRARSEAAAVPIAAGIFLDVFNIFLLLLSLLGGGRRS